MLHPHTELRYIDPEIGHGIFATRKLPKGTITWVLDPLDLVIDFDASPHLRNYPPTLERYTFVNSDGHHILCWDNARFINHSCQANCLSPGYDFEICIRDIEEGEQLTNDYGSLNLEYEMACDCASDKCRGVIRPSDFRRYAEYWDGLLGEAFARLKSVEQPLWDWVKEKDEVARCLEQPSTLPSILRHHCSEAVNGVMKQAR